MNRPGEYDLAEFAADDTPRMILCAELHQPEPGGLVSVPCSIINTPALRIILAEAGL